MTQRPSETGGPIRPAASITPARQRQVALRPSGQEAVLDDLVDADADVLLAIDSDLDDGAVGQVVLEHHIDAVPGAEPVLEVKHCCGAEAVAPDFWKMR